MLALVVAVSLFGSCGGGADDGAKNAGTTKTTTTVVPATTTTFAPIAGVRAAADDVAYASASSAQRLDLYVPDSTGGPHPVVAFFHGGAWFTGDKRGPVAAAAVPLLVAEGYAVASVNYRLSGEATFPAQLLDAKAAIRWLRAHAATYGLDAGRIAAAGESAGAHIATLLGVTAGEARFDDAALGNAGESSAVQAVVDWYGPVDLTASPSQLDANAFCIEQGRMPGELDPAIGQLLGSPAADVPGLAATANPISYLSAGRDVPPFLIAHGDHDCVVPHEGSEALAAAIDGVTTADRTTLVIVPGSGHYEQFDMEGQVPVLLDFLARTIGSG